MKTIGVITNKDRDPGLSMTRALIITACKLGGSVAIPAESAHELGMDNAGKDLEEILETSDIIVCLGGDGTFLRVARKVYRRDVPILGINLGSLGFLAEVDKNEMNIAVSDIFKGNYSVENRMMLETVITRGKTVIGKDVALNDIVISRGALSRILKIKTYINNVFVDSFPGDGLIVASPTGSTAYNLSAGGPIVEPDMEIMIVTPKCPHILYSRSFITTGDRTVKAVIEDKYEQTAMVTIDGEQGYEVCGGDTIEVRRAPYSVKLAKLGDRSFFNILRSKIYCRGENLKKDEV